MSTTVFSTVGNVFPKSMKIIEGWNNDDIVLKQISFRCYRLVGPSKGFVAILIPVGLSSGLSP